MPSVEVEMTFSYVHRRQNHHHHMWLHLGDFSGGPNHQFHDMSHVYVDENTCKCQSRMYSKGLCVRNLADNSISTSPSSPAWSNCGWGDICAHPTRLDRTCKKCMLAKVMWNENLHRSIGLVCEIREMNSIWRWEQLARTWYVQDIIFWCEPSMLIAFAILIRMHKSKLPAKSAKTRKNRRKIGMKMRERWDNQISTTQSCPGWLICIWHHILVSETEAECKCRVRMKPKTVCQPKWLVLIAGDRSRQLHSAGVSAILIRAPYPSYI
jgi:hypothetical protein